MSDFMRGNGSSLRKVYKYLLGILTLAVFVFAPSLNASAAVTYSPFDISRLVNTQNGDHLYTADEKEIVATSCTNPSGYNFEGFLGAYSASSGTILPLFRLFNPSTHKHFYTTSAAERSFAQSQGYVFEGVDVNVQTVQQTEFEPPVHRFYNPTNGDHLYTQLQQEIDSVQQLGYVDEGVVWYLPDNSTTHGDVSLIRMYNPSTQDHFYASEQEWQKVGCSNPQYKYEGVALTGFACSTRIIFCNQSNLVGRYYNKVTGMHLLSTGDENGALNGSDWVNEGLWWYRDPSQPPTQTALDVFRLRNPSTGAYVFTTSVSEKNAAMANGWVLESIPFTSEPPSGS